MPAWVYRTSYLPVAGDLFGETALIKSGFLIDIFTKLAQVSSLVNKFYRHGGTFLS
jgi:hypothetical protein